MAIIPNFKHTAKLAFIDLIQTVGVTIFFYEALPQLTIINGLILSNGLYILSTFGKCISNFFELNNRTTLYGNDIWKAILPFVLVIMQCGLMIVFVVLFSKSEDFFQWNLCILILLGVLFTSFGWYKIGFIINEMKSTDISNNQQCTMDAFIQCIASISRIIIFSIGVIWFAKDLRVIFQGEGSVFNSTKVSICGLKPNLTWLILNRKST